MNVLNDLKPRKDHRIDSLDHNITIKSFRVVISGINKKMNKKGKINVYMFISINLYKIN